MSIRLPRGDKAFDNGKLGKSLLLHRGARTVHNGQVVIAIGFHETIYKRYFTNVSPYAEMNFITLYPAQPPNMARNASPPHEARTAGLLGWASELTLPGSASVPTPVSVLLGTHSRGRGEMVEPPPIFWRYFIEIGLRLDSIVLRICRFHTGPERANHLERRTSGPPLKRAPGFSLCFAREERTSVRRVVEAAGRPLVPRARPVTRAQQSQDGCAFFALAVVRPYQPVPPRAV